MNIFVENVVLRGLGRPDLETLREWYNDPGVSGLLGGFTYPVSQDQPEHWFQRSLEDQRPRRFAVADRVTGDLVGLVGLWEIDWLNRRPDRHHHRSQVAGQGRRSGRHARLDEAGL